MPKVRAQLHPALGQIIYRAIRGAVCVAGMGDLAQTLSIAKRAGRAFGDAGFNRKRLARAEENIAVAFPQWGPDLRREYAVRSYEHLFMLGVEVLFTPRLLTHEGWAGRVNLHNLEPAVRAMVSGRPVIFICGHCGNWEMAGYSLSLLGFPVHALYRPLDLKPADEWVREQRGRRGLVLVDKFGAARLMPQILSSGMPLGFVADQNAGDRGIFVPFFNRMASTYKAIGLSATRYNATIIVGMARRSGGQTLSSRSESDGRSIVTLAREPDGLRYDLSMVDIFGPEDYFAQPDPLFYIAARYRRAIEQSVREAPEQFLWMHRYWKSRPRWERQGRAVPESIVRKLRELPWMTEADLDAIRAHAEHDTRAYAESRPAGSPPERETPESDDDF